MLEINSLVVYGGNGVCKVEDLREENLSGIKRMFYILKPLGIKNSTFYIPADSEKLLEKGQNFKKYLNNMRFEYAKKLLEHTEMTVMQVCTESGFNDYPNFIRRFKQHTTYYPAEYRNLYK